MLPKDLRLTNQDEIRSILRSKLTSKTQHTIIKIQKSDLPNFRIVVIISKKIFKRANKRNRIRRKINGVFEELKYNDRLPPFMSCVIQVQNKNIITQTNSLLKVELLPQLGSLFSKLVKQIQFTKMPN